MNNEILFCKKCNRRETFVISGTKGVCLACNATILDLPATRQRTIHDCFFEFLGAVSNGIDRNKVTKEFLKSNDDYLIFTENRGKYTDEKE